ncbi:hypothetical protein Tco_0774232 [Tanacetum coccineum]|uniref:Uncharacterized protein n=1 Tax=Tanacetum coccineum TaxID=301880 RepID=A0ABQ4ZQN2_9ASTR
MPTEMELTLEQTPQGVSYEVSVDPHGFEETFKDGDWNGYLRKRRKTKPKRQKRTRNGKAWKRQSQDKAQV